MYQWWVGGRYKGIRRWSFEELQRVLSGFLSGRDHGLAGDCVAVAIGGHRFLGTHVSSLRSEKICTDLIGAGN